MDATPPSRLLRPGRARAVRRDPRGFYSFVAGAVGSESGRFAGGYGRAYSAIIRRPLLRRLISTALWGRGTALPRLEHLLDAAADACPAGGVIVDVPCGAGWAMERLAVRRPDASILACDLSGPMLARAAGRVPSRAATTHLLQCDALDLPIRDVVADVVVSINGLHCMSDPGRFIDRIGHLLRAGGVALVVTMVSDDSVRHRAVMKWAISSDVIPAPAPTLTGISQMVAAAGLTLEEPAIGHGNVALRLRRP